MFIAAPPLEVREPGADDLLPLTSGERDLLRAFRKLAPRAQKHFRQNIINEASMWEADLQAVMRRNNVTGVASDERVAAALPTRPDGDQPDTTPGALEPAKATKPH